MTLPNESQPYRQIDKFDRMRGSMVDLPDVTRTKPSTVVAGVPIIGATQTVIVETFRQAEIGDTIFLQVVDDGGSIRIFLPAAVADVIARQRDALTTKNRKRAAKNEAARRKAAGIEPGFLKLRKKKA
jgi:hypothetical protein